MAARGSDAVLPACRPRAPQCRLCSPSWVKNAAFVSSAQPSPAPEPRHVPPGRQSSAQLWPAAASFHLFIFAFGQQL